MAATPSLLNGPPREWVGPYTKPWMPEPGSEEWAACAVVIAYLDERLGMPVLDYLYEAAIDDFVEFPEPLRTHLNEDAGLTPNVIHRDWLWLLGRFAVDLRAGSLTPHRS